MCQTVPLGNGSVSSYKGQNYPQKYHLGEKILTTSNFDSYFNFVPLARAFKALVKNRFRGEISTPKDFFTKVIFSNQMRLHVWFVMVPLTYVFNDLLKILYRGWLLPASLTLKVRSFISFKAFRLKYTVNKIFLLLILE